MAAEFAVDLEDKFDFLSFERCFHGLRPSRIKNISLKSEFSPEVMTDVRGYRRKYSQ